MKNERIVNRYFWGAAQDELLCENDNWTLRDHLNTVRDVINSRGKVVSHLKYNAFGALVLSKGTLPLFRHTGKMFDDATGLQWNINGCTVLAAAAQFFSNEVVPHAREYDKNSNWRIDSFNPPLTNKFTKSFTPPLP